MEEAAAAELYNELLQSGGNAAKFKQGLGFGTHSTSVVDSAPVRNKEEHGYLSGFVKGSSLGKAPGPYKESRIEIIRDKLQEREESSTLEGRRSRPHFLEGTVSKSLDKPESKDRGRRKTPDDSESEERLREKSRRRRRSSPLGKTERAFAKKTPDKERTGRSRSRIKGNRRGSSRSLSDDSNSSGSSARRRKRSRTRKRDGSVSRKDDSRSRHGRRSSRSRSYEGRTWNGSHSRRRGREVDYNGDYRRGRAYTPRERSRSPPPRRSSYYNHTESRSRGRSDIDRSRRRHENDRRDERSPRRQRDGKPGAKVLSGSARAREKASKRDSSFFNSEKVKAKANLKPSDTDPELNENHTKDLTNGPSSNWERFNFDKDAPLDDDTKLDYFGDESRTRDDTLLLKNTGGSYNQGKREVSVTAKHEASIFGPVEGLSLKMLEADREAVGVKKDKECDESPRHEVGFVSSINDTEDKDPNSATAFVSSVLSEQVIAMQNAGSWQERALRMRKAREAALSH